MPLRLFTADGREKIHAKGEDQLFSFKGVLQVAASGAISGENGYLETAGPVSGEVWIVTTLMARDDTTAPTVISAAIWDSPARWEFHYQVKAFAISERSVWSGHVFLEYGDTIRAWYTGGLADDACVIALNGYKMTVEG